MGEAEFSGWNGSLLINKEESRMIHMMVMKSSWSINSYLEKYRYGWSHTEKCINMCIYVD